MTDRKPPGDPRRCLARLVAPKGGPELPPDRVRAHSAALVDAALEQGVGGLLLTAAADHLERDAAARLHASVAVDTAQHLRCLVVLEQIAGALDRAGIPWAVLKGPVLVEAAYGGVARPYLDLDILVSPGDFAEALGALEAADGQLEDRNWELASRDRRAQLHLRWGAAGIPVDLHWHLVNRGGHRDGFRLGTEELLDRRLLFAPMVSGGHGRPGGVPTLDPTDRVIHYALHAALSGGHRLIWMADLALSVMRGSPDWDRLVDRCRRWRTELPVATLLARTERTLGPIVPPGVVDLLARTPARRRLVARLSAWQPSGRLPGGGSVTGGLTQSLSGTLPGTAWHAAARSLQMARRMLDPYPHWLDPGDPASMTFPSGGGDAGRARYLSGVRRETWRP